MGIIIDIERKKIVNWIIGVTSNYDGVSLNGQYAFVKMQSAYSYVL